MDPTVRHDELVSSATATVIRGAQLVLAENVRSTDLRIDGGRISAIGESVDGAGARTVDGTGGYLAPGFIDTLPPGGWT